MRFAVIAKDYARSWFFIDLIACVPIDLIQIIIKLIMPDAEYTNDDARLAKLARVPRMYRIIHIIRIFKVLKVFKYKKGLLSIIKKLKLKAGTNRLVVLICTMLFLCHLIGCIWYMQARLIDFNTNTWVN